MRTILILGAIPLLLLGCGGATGSSKTLDVVAAENVYGDIVSQIGGRHVSVTSILSDPNADPHLFEPGTRNGLAVATADLVVQNGLGYDAFMSRLEEAAPSSGRIVVTIADALGVHGHDANPHLWYDVPALPGIGAAIGNALAKADPANAADYRAGSRRFRSSLAPLDREVALIRKRYGGAPVAGTEPLSGYLLAAAGLRDLAPSAFTRAIEDGSEPSPQAVAQMTDLITSRRVRVLLYNSQAVSPITVRLRDAARRAGVPVVPVSETLPPQRTFQQWQLAQARALAAALGT
jgi:zinc/manganese transport system substrate-binding protein